MEFKRVVVSSVAMEDQERLRGVALDVLEYRDGVFAVGRYQSDHLDLLVILFQAYDGWQVVHAEWFGSHQDLATAITLLGVTAKLGA